jgi:hypothetical protein
MGQKMPFLDQRRCGAGIPGPDNQGLTVATWRRKTPKKSRAFTGDQAKNDADESCRTYRRAMKRVAIQQLFETSQPRTPAK